MAEVEEFLAEFSMPPTRFGRATPLRDGSLVPQLRRGRNVTLKTAALIREYMARYRATHIPETAL
jgi:hypothetical protein